MQEGAGVRQIVEDELRALGLRLRDLDVRLELGLQESVRSAVQAGYGVAFISRSAVESELAAGHADVRAGRRARRQAGDLARSRCRSYRHARGRRVRRVRARQARGVTQSCRQEGVRGNRRVPPIERAAAEQQPQRAGGSRRKPGFPRATEPKAKEPIVRWGIDELDELAGERPLVVASPRWRHVSTPRTGGGGPVAPDRGPGGRRHDRRRRRRERDRHREGGVRRDRLAARLGPDDVLRGGVDDVLWRPRSGPADAWRRRRGKAARDRLCSRSSRSTFRARRRSAPR